MTFKNRFCCEKLTSGLEKNKTKALSCELFTNQHLTIQGQSGSGKSTILKVLATLFPKKSGKLFWNDQEITTANFAYWRQKINYLPQEPVMGAISIYEALMLPWQLNIIKQQKPDKKYLKSMLSEFGFDQIDLDKEVKLLSGGEKQRICFIRGSLMKRPIWLLDEPTSALDRESTLLLIKHLKSQNVLSISISHDPLWINAFKHVHIM